MCVNPVRDLSPLQCYPGSSRWLNTHTHTETIRAWSVSYTISLNHVSVTHAPVISSVHWRSMSVFVWTHFITEKSMVSLKIRLQTPKGDWPFDLCVCAVRAHSCLFDHSSLSFLPYGQMNNPQNSQLMQLSFRHIFKETSLSLLFFSFSSFSSPALFNTHLPLCTYTCINCVKHH